MPPLLSKALASTTPVSEPWSTINPNAAFNCSLPPKVASNISI